MIVLEEVKNVIFFFTSSWWCSSINERINTLITSWFLAFQVPIVPQTSLIESWSNVKKKTYPSRLFIYLWKYFISLICNFILVLEYSILRATILIKASISKSYDIYKRIKLRKYIHIIFLIMKILHIFNNILIILQIFQESKKILYIYIYINSMYTNVSEVQK